MRAVTVQLTIRGGLRIHDRPFRSRGVGCGNTARVQQRRVDRGPGRSGRWRTDHVHPEAKARSDDGGYVERGRSVVVLLER